MNTAWMDTDFAQVAEKEDTLTTEYIKYLTTGKREGGSAKRVKQERKPKMQKDERLRFNEFLIRKEDRGGQTIFHVSKLIENPPVNEFPLQKYWRNNEL